MSSPTTAGRVAAVDLGEVRCGIAISDETATIARPLEVVGEREIEERLRGLIDREGVSVVVVGVPKTMRGEEGPQARKVLEKIGRMRERFPAVRFVEWDERLTTRLAGDGKKKGPVDHLAAAHMLQEYLWARRS